MATAAEFTTLAASFSTLAAQFTTDAAAAVAAFQALAAAGTGVNPTDLDAPLASMNTSLAALQAADTQIKAATPPPPAPPAA